MKLSSQEVLDGLRELDSATVFNGVVANLGGAQSGHELENKVGVPENYTGPEIRCFIPEFGCVVGYAITAEVTTNDPDSRAIPWDDYYQALEKTDGPIIAVMKDVDTRPGRGASFGDGMAAQHRILGVVGALVDGSVRDLKGIKEVGLPMWGKGLVPGHGTFNLISINKSITVGQLLVHPGEILVCDTDGCTKIPEDLDPEGVLQNAREVRSFEQKIHAFYKTPGFTLKKMKQFVKSISG